MLNFLTQFFGFFGTRIIDLIALIFNVVSVGALALNRKWIGWISGFIGSVALLIIYLETGLIFDSSLMVYYIITTFLGVALWALIPKRREKKELAITEMPAHYWRYIVPFVLLFTVVFGYAVLALGFTELGYFIYVDAFTTGLSIVAQWMLAKKWFSNWYVWIVADVIDIWLYFTKGLPMIAILVIVYLFQCAYGLYHWTKVRREQEDNPQDVLHGAAVLVPAL